MLNLNDRLSFYEGAHLQKPDGEWVPALSTEDAQRFAAKGIGSVCYEWWPDVIVIVSGFFIPPETWGLLARRPHHVVMWCTESPYEDDKQAQAARYVDTVVLNDPTNLATFKQLRRDEGLPDAVADRVYYMPHSYDPAKHRLGRPDPRLQCDFAFVGTGFPSRIEFFEQVDWSGIDARFGGNWQQLGEDSPLVPLLVDRQGVCMDNGDAAALYRASRVLANLYRKETTEDGSAEGWAIGPREVELAACGSFFLREPRAEGDALFPSLPTFTTPAEFEDQLRWWLAHPLERQAAADQARKAIADRTFKNTAAKLLRLVDGVPSHIR